MRRKWKNKLGVSTVIANMLMILITLSLAAILVAWAGTSYGAFTGGTQVFFAQRGQALQERLVIEEIFFVKGSNNYLRVFVRDVGVQQVNVVSLYVNGTSYQPASSWNTQTAGTTHVVTPCAATQVNGNWVVIVTIGSACEFQLAIPNGFDTRCSSLPWCSGDVFEVVVATSRGNQATSTARGP